MKLAPGYFVAALLAFSACLALGTWQLQRGAAKRDRLEQQRGAERGAPRALAPLLGAPSGEASVLEVDGRGRYLGLLLLDQQQRHGRVGVRVYGVAEVEGAAPRLLVDLGWLPMPPERVAPQPALPAGPRPLRGLLAPWPGQGLRLADNPRPESGPFGPRLLTYLDRTELQRDLGLPLDARVLRLAPELDYGWARDRDLLPNTLPPERHYGYALQWYALAAAVAAIYFILRRRAQRRATA